jgi:magnesium transporter
MLKAYCAVPGEEAREMAESEVAERLADGRSHIWIDISSGVEHHLPLLRDVMRFHPLAIEDLSHPRMLPKVEDYDGCLFLVLHDIVLLDKEGGERLKTYELFIFLGRNYVVTVRRHRVRAIELMHGDFKVLTHLFARGAESVCHGIVRRMIDNYFPMLDRIDEKLDDSERAIFNSPSSHDMQRVFTLRKDVAKLRAVASQELDVINRLTTGEFDQISPHGVMLARDLYDHLYRVTEKAAGYRETTMGLLDAYLSQINNRMNEVMKVLTVIATIMLPLGIVVGFYGMNFKHMPGLDYPHAWIFTAVGMAVIIGGMLSYFRYRKWL